MKSLGFGTRADFAGGPKGLPVPPGEDGDQTKLAGMALIQAEAQDLRWRDDGVNPAAGAGTGMLLAKGTTMEYRGDLAAIKFMETIAGGVLNVTYYTV